MGVVPGRHTAKLEGDFVVFIIGTRMNRLWKLHRWVPVAWSMPRMLVELAAEPDSGFLGATLGLMTCGPTVIQYWRSFADLERYARDPDARHLPNWRRFNRGIRASGDVGVWHETYFVRGGEYEAIYVNMPEVGLGAASQLEPLGSSSTAATRSGTRADDVAPVDG